MISKLLISIGISIGLLGVLIHFILSSADQGLWSSLIAILFSYPLIYALLYFVVSLVKTLFQSWRFQVLLRSSEARVPELFHIYLVTLSRNMFVDMLPARLGELSYIAMLNRGCKVSGESCVSSLAISFVFDLIALGVLIAVLLFVQLVGGGFQGWMAGVLIMLALLIVFLLALLYPAIALVNRVLDQMGWFKQGIWGKGRNLLKRIEQALEDTRRAGITRQLLVLSVCVRAAKYFGLYLLFIGVVSIQFPEMSISIEKVLPALVSAEAGASLPVPAFMGFGTYEAAGTLALTALGATASTSLIVMLAMHVVSQIIDYLLGGVGFILFIFKTGQITDALVAGKRFSRKLLIPVVLTVIAALFLAYEMRTVKKRGMLKAPDSGGAVITAPAVTGEVVDKLDGFLVWSSNRSGNHDIYMRSFPDGTIRQLTTHFLISSTSHAFLRKGNGWFLPVRMNHGFPRGMCMPGTSGCSI